MSTLHSPNHIAAAIFEATPAQINEINNLIKGKNLVLTSLESHHSASKPIVADSVTETVKTSDGFIPKKAAKKAESTKPKYVRPSRRKADK